MRENPPDNRTVRIAHRRGFERKLDAPWSDCSDCVRWESEAIQSALQFCFVGLL